jgi:hypothetical protein
MDLAPKSVLPFDQYMSGITIPDQQGGIIHYEGIIEAYYMCGEIEKANAILKEFYEDLAEEFNYLNSMKPRHKNYIQREMSECIYKMEELKLLLQQFNQQDLMLQLGISSGGTNFPG